METTYEIYFLEDFKKALLCNPIIRFNSKEDMLKEIRESDEFLPDNIVIGKSLWNNYRVFISSTILHAPPVWIPARYTPEYIGEYLCFGINEKHDPKKHVVNWNGEKFETTDFNFNIKHWMIVSNP